MFIYYVYAYLRKDHTPYYIGKGKKSRAFSPHHKISVPEDKSQIVFIKENLDEYEALDLEKRLIRWYGRKDIGTGILRNMTDGGENPPVHNGNKFNLGRIPTEETRKLWSQQRKGRSSWNKGKPGVQKHSEETRRKISELGKGKIISEETRRKISEAKKGKTHSEETRRKISQSLRLRRQ